MKAPTARATVTCAVTSTADTGDGTLRQKIGDATCDVITFSDTIYPGTIALTSGTLTIDRHLTITGPGADKLTVKRMDGPEFRIFKVTADATAVISGITISHGLLNQLEYFDNLGLGAGIWNLGVLTITDSTLEYNVAVTTDENVHNGLGGAIANFNWLTVERVTFRENQALAGAGIANAGIAMVTNSTFSVTNSTFTNDSCTNGAGVLNFDGTTTVINSTISASEGCSLVETWAQTITLKNTILQHVSDAGIYRAPNCNVYYTSGFIDGGGNLSNDGSCRAAYHNLDPMLGPLAYNGGPTQTMALLPGSPAIDTGVACPPPATDQRGVSRPQGSGCDIGAYELIQQAGPVFSGFLAPVSNPPAVNTVKAGQAIPVKFGLGGDWSLNIVASGYPASRQVACPLSSGSGTLIDTVTAGDSSLTYDSTTQTYTYIWKTDKTWASTCRELVVVLSDLNHTTRTATFGFSK